MANEADRPRRGKWRSYAFNALFLILLIAGIRVWQQRDMVNGAAPDLQGVTITGQPYQLPLHASQPVLVHFWASWCPVCRAEQNSIAAIAHDHPNVITIAMQSGSSDEVVRHMRKQGIDFPVVNDPQGRISNAWGVHAVPATFVISPDGQIRFVEVGYTTGLGLRLRLWWAGL